MIDMLCNSFLIPPQTTPSATFTLLCSPPLHSLQYLRLGVSSNGYPKNEFLMDAYLIMIDIPTSSSPPKHRAKIKYMSCQFLYSPRYLPMRQEISPRNDLPENHIRRDCIRKCVITYPLRLKIIRPTTSQLSRPLQ